MKFHKQIHLHFKDNKQSIQGSCYPTVIACILDKELEDIPNFNILYWTEIDKENIRKGLYKRLVKKNRDKLLSKEQQITQCHNKEHEYIDWLWYNVMDAYLLSQGKKEKIIKNIESWLKKNPNKPYLVDGLSSRNILHVCIYMNGKLYHDPHPSNEGLITEEKYYEIINY